jgi:hypothetical protein
VRKRQRNRKTYVEKVRKIYRKTFKMERLKDGATETWEKRERKTGRQEDRKTETQKHKVRWT